MPTSTVTQWVMADNVNTVMLIAVAQKKNFPFVKLIPPNADG